MRWIFRFIFERVLGWKVVGIMDPNIKKAVLIVAPHTSWHDFYLGVFSRKIINLEMNFVGKNELFNPVFGWYFRWMGGEPIDRSKSMNTVDQIVEIYNSREEFRLAISPEGTRKKVKVWKTGFYYIAEKAKVPIIPVAFDYSRKEVQLNEAFYITGDIEKDLKVLKSNFKGVVGKIPEYS
jgi:1-acyl-sn-glycerol-3-phosphate acyltransferase